MAEYINKQAFLDHMMGTSRYFTVKFDICDIEDFPAADFIAFDELTHFTQEEYEYLKSRNR